MSDSANADSELDTQLSTRQIADAILIVEEKLSEFKRLDLKVVRPSEVDRVLRRLVSSTNKALKDTLGAATSGLVAYELESLIPQREAIGQNTSLKARLPDITVRLNWAVTALEDLLDRLREMYPTPLSLRDRVKVVTWDNLGLNRRIAQASFEAYLAGDYVRAVLAALAALNDHPRFKRAQAADAHRDRDPWVSFGALTMVVKNATASSTGEQTEAPKLELTENRAEFGTAHVSSLVGDDSQRALQAIGLISLMATLADETEDEKSEQDSSD